MIKSMLSPSMRLSIRVFLSWMNDFRRGYTFHFAQRQKHDVCYSHTLHLTQDLKPNDAKLHNLKIAASKIGQVIIMPNQVFSFWKTVGAPTQRNGFVGSRSIVGDQIQDSIGGGLCQLSGLIYYLSLQAKLDILERYNHSADIYTEETRFTPLGSDATVVYGYKDLKVRNNLNHPILFAFEINTNTIAISLTSDAALVKRVVNFEKSITEGGKIKVDTIQDGEKINTSYYSRLEVR